MDNEALKCVMVLDEELPGGIAANTAAIMGVTLGSCFPEVIGPDVADGSGMLHRGIIQTPVPILKAGREGIRELRSRLYEPEFEAVTVVDFSDVAQGCNHYEDFQEKAASTAESEFRYFGIGLCGPKKLVNRLTGSLPLFR